MKHLLLLTWLLLTNITSYCQGGIRLYIQKPNSLLYKQTIIAFSDSTTDGVDNEDVYMFGNTENAIFTKINNQPYSFNYLNYLNEDKIIPIYTNINPDTGMFVIGIDERYGDFIPVGLFDSVTNTVHNLETPYICQGPVYNRFSLLFEKPISLEIVDGCDVGYVVVNNDTPEFGYVLQQEGTNNTMYISSDVDTLFDLTNGNYTLSLPYESIYESINFSINNTVIDASLNIPFTTVYLGDSYITPILNIYSPYTYVEWDFGDGVIFGNDLNPVHYYSQLGIYTLKVTITEGQCVKKFESQITVNGPLGMDVIEYKNFPRHKPTTFYYAIDGKLVKRP